DGALERTAERDADRDLDAEPVCTRTLGDAEPRLERLLHRRVLVSAVERLGRPQRVPDLVQPRSRAPLLAALVPGAARTYPPRLAVARAHALLRSRHLRDASRVDEARALDHRQVRTGEALDELRADLGGEDVRLVLEAVSRPDIADRHARAGRHEATLPRPS